MNKKRWTACLLRSHRWATVAYPAPKDEQAGYFIRCLRCGYENHKSGNFRPTGLA